MSGDKAQDMTAVDELDQLRREREQIERERREIERERQELARARATRESHSNNPSTPQSPPEPRNALNQLLGSGVKLQSPGGQLLGTEAVDGKVLALYFSAHWCPPCRAFTPQLAQWYTRDLKAKGLEIVFISKDRNEDSFKAYFREMPWLALDFADRDSKQKLSERFKVSGIPKLVLVDSDGVVMDKRDGRRIVSADPTGRDFPWRSNRSGTSSASSASSGDLVIGSRVRVQGIQSDPELNGKAGAADSYWITAKKGDRIPDNVIVGGVYLTDGSGQLFVGRASSGEVGKINTDGEKLKHLWCHDGGKSESFELLVCPSGQREEWIPYKKGDEIPLDAFVAGNFRSDRGDIYAGRLSGEVGKINTQDGKLHHLYCHHQGQKTEGDILVFRKTR